MKDKMLNIRLTSEELEKLRKVAESQHRSVSAQALMYIIKSIDNEKKLP